MREQTGDERRRWIQQYADRLLQHSSREVRILLACCLADILRMFAPDAPYGDPEQLKVCLWLWFAQFLGHFYDN